MNPEMHELFEKAKRDLCSLVAEEDSDRQKELVDKTYASHFEKSLAIAEEIITLRDKLESKGLSEKDRVLTELKIALFSENYAGTSQIMRYLTQLRESGLTNAPED